MKRKPNRRTVRDALRASVPDGKLKGARIVLKDDTSTMRIGGFTEYERVGGKVIRLGAPASDDSFGVSIRAHEAAHASHHKPLRKKPVSEVEAVISQIIDDVNIEALPVPEIGASRAYRRAKLATAMRDVRNIVRVTSKVRSGAMVDSVNLRNGNLQAGTRAIAMLRAYGQGEFTECQVRERAFGKLRNAIGFKMVQAIGKVAQVAVSRRQRAKAFRCSWH
jgi:hypothetical protein